jgi:hypothetical protein
MHGCTGIQQNIDLLGCVYEISFYSADKVYLLRDSQPGSLLTQSRNADLKNLPSVDHGFSSLHRKIGFAKNENQVVGCWHFRIEENQHCTKWLAQTRFYLSNFGDSEDGTIGLFQLPIVREKMSPLEITTLVIIAIVLTGLIINTVLTLVISFKGRMDPKVKERLRKVTWN